MLIALLQLFYCASRFAASSLPFRLGDFFQCARVTVPTFWYWVAASILIPAAFSKNWSGCLCNESKLYHYKHNYKVKAAFFTSCVLALMLYKTPWYSHRADPKQAYRWTWICFTCLNLQFYICCYSCHFLLQYGTNAFSSLDTKITALFRQWFQIQNLSLINFFNLSKPNSTTLNGQNKDRYFNLLSRN